MEIQKDLKKKKKKKKKITAVAHQRHRPQCTSAIT